LAEAVFHTLRPYGGVACAWGSLADRSRIEEIVKDEAFPGADVQQAGDFVLLVRSGALPGAADWSHAEANAASTGASEDELRSPNAVLWFGASQRWHKYPGQNQVRVSGGRLIVYEQGFLRAGDVYTGRKIWEVELSEEALDRADHPLPQQLRLDRPGHLRDHAVLRHPTGLPGEQQPVPGQRCAEHAESHRGLHVQLRSGFGGLCAGGGGSAGWGGVNSRSAAPAKPRRNHQPFSTVVLEERGLPSLLGIWTKLTAKTRTA
jgi:hypothetical protein